MIERKETPINEVSKKDLLKRDGLTILLGILVFIDSFIQLPKLGITYDKSMPKMLEFFLAFYYPFIIYVSFIIHWKLIKKVEIPSWFWLIGRQAVFSLRPPKQ